MSEGGDDPQGVVDLAVALPFVAAALFMPPLLHLFAEDLSLGGIPLILLYVFGAWAGLIAVAFLLARRLGEEREPAGPSAVEHGPEPSPEPGDVNAGR